MTSRQVKELEDTVEALKRALIAAGVAPGMVEAIAAPPCGCEGVTLAEGEE